MMHCDQQDENEKKNTEAETQNRKRHSNGAYVDGLCEEAVI